MDIRQIVRARLGIEFFPEQIPEDDSDEDFIIPVPENTHNEIISLQDSCLNTIVTNLKRFVVAFNSSKDETLQRNILFLRRRYSTKIMQKFNQMEPGEFSLQPQEEVQDSWRFLLNEYLQEFRFTQSICSPIDKAVFLERIAEMGHALRTVDLDMYFQPGGSFIERCIPHLSNVNVLYIPSYCSNQILSIISASCPMLRELYCQTLYPRNSNIFNDEGVKNLCLEENGALVPNRTLKKLYCYSDYGYVNPIPDIDVPFILTNFKSLENLNHPVLPLIIYEIHKLDLSKVTSTNINFNITNINLLIEDTELSSSLYEFLLACKEVCPHLKKLSTWIDDERELDLILLFSELKSLRIEQGSSEIDLNSFLKSKGKVFKELILQKFSISVDVLIQNSPELEFLYLNEVKFQDDSDCEEAYQFPKLRKLHVTDIGNTGIIKPIKTILNACPNVEELVIDGFTLKGLETLIYFTEFSATRKSLLSITFRNCWIRPILLRSIVTNCSRLKTLTLKYLLNEDDIHHYDIFELTPHKKRYVKVGYVDMDDMMYEYNKDEYEFE